MWPGCNDQPLKRSKSVVLSSIIYLQIEKELKIKKSSKTGKGFTSLLHKEVEQKQYKLLMIHLQGLQGWPTARDSG
jgi:hypothetical protein